MSETITINTYPIQETIDVTTVNDVTTINVNVVQSSGAVSSVNGLTGDITLDIPTATSDLTNDSGFITANDVEASNENVVTILAQSPEGQFNRAHGTLVINDKLYIGTREGATSKLLRYNGTTLEESIIVPMDSAKGIENMCYDGTKIFFCVNHSGNFLVEVDPLDFTGIVYHTITGVNLLDAVICTDNTYIYGVEHEPANIKFFKIRISDFTVVATNTWTGRFKGHSVGINIPAGYMNVTTQGKEYARVQLSDLSFAEKDLTGYSTIMTDDMVVIRDDQNEYGTNYVILGSEFYDGSDSVGGLLLNTDLLTDPIKIPMMPTVGLFLSNDGMTVYNASAEGFIQTWDLAALLFSLFFDTKIETNVYTYRGYGFPNEILETSTDLYFTNWDTTTNKGVINKCELVAKDKPLITQREAYFNSLAKANVSDLDTKVDKVTGERLINATEITKLANTSGTNSGDNAVNSLYSGLASSKQDTLTESNTHTFVDSLTAMTTPVDADRMIIVDNSVSLAKRITWANIKAGLKTYFDSIYTTTSAVATQITTALSSYATTSYVTSALASFKTTNFLDFTSSGQTQLDAKANKADFMVLLNAYVLSNSTSLQKMFNVGSGSGGAFNASANKTYRFRIEFDLTGLSTTSSTISFGFLGTAVITSINYKMNSTKNTLATISSANIQSLQTASGTVVTAATTNATAKGMLSGIIRVSTAGTIIPAVSTSIGVATAQVEVNSYAEFVEIGSNTVTASSNIS